MNDIIYHFGLDFQKKNYTRFKKTETFNKRLKTE